LEKCERRRRHRAAVPCAWPKPDANIQSRKIVVSGFIWIVVVGFIAGIIARILSPGANNPSGFILTTVLGIAGAFLATFIGQAVGWYRPDQGAGFITATIGALIVLFIWNRLVVHRIVPDPSAGPGPRQ
jgi:uncharacterized membrane protein YeaQ/YmgE (transglycosylase-associated protein family)